MIHKIGDEVYICNIPAKVKRDLEHYHKIKNNLLNSFINKCKIYYCSENNELKNEIDILLNLCKDSEILTNDEINEILNRYCPNYFNK